MIRSSATSCAILSATDWVIEGSNELTFEARLADGIGGRFHTRPVAETGPESAAGGSAPAAAPGTHLATGRPQGPPFKVNARARPGARPAGGRRASFWVKGQ